MITCLNLTNQLQIVKHSLKIFNLILLIVFGGMQLLSAQVSGFVVDEKTGNAIPGANAFIKGKNYGAITDHRGFFSIPYQSPMNSSDSLVVSLVGYVDFREALTHFKDGSRIRLVTKNLMLGKDIAVYGDRIDMARQELPHIRDEIDAEEIQRTGSREIADLFKKIPSVRIEGNDLDGRRLQIRGSNASEVNVYLDGILINSLSQDNSADLSIISPDNIEKLEVLKGANLTLLGTGAFGGVLNVTSRRQLDTGLMFKTRLGEFETRQYTGSVNIPISKKLYLSYFGQSGRMKPQIEYFPGERFTPKSSNNFIDTRKQHHSLNLDYYMTDGQIRARVFAYDLDYNKPFWHNRRRNYLAALSYEGSGETQISVSSISSQDDVRRYTVESTQFLTAFLSNRLNMKAAKQFSWSISRLQLVAEYFHDELENTSKINDLLGQRTYYKANIYENRTGLGAVWSFEDRLAGNKDLSWRTYFGARGDLSAGGYSDLSPSWGIQVNTSKGKWQLSPYLSYGKNVKYPSLLESAYIKDLYIYGDRDTVHQQLEPEYVYSYEAGLPFSRRLSGEAMITGSLAFFSNTIYNKILRRPLGDAMVQSQIGRNVTRGLEASLKLEHLYDLLDITASYTNLDISNPLLYDYKPAQSLALQMDLITSWGFYFNSIYFHEGRGYAWYFDSQNELQTDRIDPNWDVDVSIGYAFQLRQLGFSVQSGRGESGPAQGVNIKGLEFDIDLSCHNVFDNSGFDYYYLRKRFFSVSFSVRY